MKFTIAPALLLSMVSAVLAFPLEARSGTPLTQAAAQALLEKNGIYSSSTGGCTSKSISTCTSYDGILSGTVNGAISLKGGAGASTLTITGGTEVGHSGSGTYTHANGYKIDVRHDTAVDNYIKGQFTKIANRGDGYPQWQSPSGNLFCDEGSHWDITIY